jgi:hypothetical protein
MDHGDVAYEIWAKVNYFRIQSNDGFNIRGFDVVVYSSVIRDSV